MDRTPSVMLRTVPLPYNYYYIPYSFTLYIHSTITIHGLGSVVPDGTLGTLLKSHMYTPQVAVLPAWL